MTVGFRVWLCLSCGKEWKIPRDVSYPWFTCNCGSTEFQLKTVMDAMTKRIGEEVMDAIIKKMESVITEKVREEVRRSIRVRRPRRRG